MTNHLYDGVFGQHATSSKIFLYTDTGEVRFADFTALTDRLAGLLVASGLAPGDRVAVQADKSVMLLALYAATVKAGGVYLPLNTGYTAAELDYFLGDAKPRIVVAGTAAADAIAPLAARGGATLFTLDADETGSLAEAAAQHPPEFTAVPRDSEDLAAILYTSGTTGRSKGAKLCHRNLLSNAAVLRDYWRFSADDVLLHMLPIYHTHGLFVASNLLAMVGGSMIFLPKFSADAALHWMPTATTMMGVPTFYTRLLDHDGFTGDASAHMRLFISGSAPLLAETHRQFAARTGKAILERYGMTEAGMITSNPYNGNRIAGTVGFPLDGISARVSDETGKELKDGEIGTLEIKGPNVFKGYWKLPEKTKEEFREDGFFITGDLACRDQQGYLSIVGRGKDLIISGGLNVYPKEVEDQLNQIEGVQESAVFGLSHSDFGEAVTAVIVSNHNTFSEELILEHLRPKLASFKLPKRILPVSELPRNSMGKVQKKLLREQHSELYQN